MIIHWETNIDTLTPLLLEIYTRQPWHMKHSSRGAQSHSPHVRHPQHHTHTQLSLKWHTITLHTIHIINQLHLILIITHYSHNNDMYNKATLTNANVNPSNIREKRQPPLSHSNSGQAGVSPWVFVYLGRGACEYGLVCKMTRLAGSSHPDHPHTHPLEHPRSIHLMLFRLYFVRIFYACRLTIPFYLKCNGDLAIITVTICTSRTLGWRSYIHRVDVFTAATPPSVGWRSPRSQYPHLASLGDDWRWLAMIGDNQRSINAF